MWRRGGPAPWHGATAALPDPLSADAVVRALHAAGLGNAASPRAPVAEWPGVPRLESPAMAAVLVALFDAPESCHVLFERRSNDLRRHRGEVAFPGGLADPGETPEATALREAHEELGVPPRAVEVVGRLTPLRTYSGQVVIEPVVGVLAGRPELRVQPAEVAYAFDVPLAALLDDGAFHEELWRREPAEGIGDDPADVAILVYEVGDETIWGATARILTELCCVVAGLGALPAPRGAGGAGAT